jgi:hypothetical protein
MSAEDVLLHRLERALAYGGNTHTVNDVLDAVARGDAQMIGDAKGLLVTELQHYPQMAAIRIWLASGELRACLDLLPQVERFAREVGARRLDVVGRMGWARALATRGWAAKGLWLSKEIEP